METEKELAMKASKLLMPELTEKVMQENWKHAQFVVKLKETLFEYMKPLSVIQRDTVVLHLVAEIVQSIPPCKRVSFIQRVLYGISEHNKLLPQANELVKRLKEHQEEFDVTGKKN